ncbi:hypothetical protein, partial [Akkermansia sp.]|uniref:hypothetical protein n=1 Tax=Akkermansia sp. TaxID=1872421 RepID=UPI003FD7F62A
MGFRSIPIFVLKYETDVLFSLKLSSSIFSFGDVVFSVPAGMPLRTNSAASPSPTIACLIHDFNNEPSCRHRPD